MQNEQSAIALLLFRVGPVLCCTPANPVQTIIAPPKLTRPPGSSTAKPGIFYHTDHVVSVSDLRHRFGVNESERDKTGRVIITEHAGAYTGYWVDEIMEVIDTPAEGWSEPPTHLPKGVFSKTLLLKEKIFLYADFSQFENLPETGYLSQYINRLTDPIPADDTESSHDEHRQDTTINKPDVTTTSTLNSDGQDKAQVATAIDIPPASQSEPVNEEPTPPVVTLEAETVADISDAAEPISDKPIDPPAPLATITEDAATPAETAALHHATTEQDITGITQMDDDTPLAAPPSATDIPAETDEIITGDTVHPPDDEQVFTVQAEPDESSQVIGRASHRTDNEPALITENLTETPEPVVVYHTTPDGQVDDRADEDEKQAEQVELETPLTPAEKAVRLKNEFLKPVPAVVPASEQPPPPPPFPWQRLIAPLILFMTIAGISIYFLSSSDKTGSVTVKTTPTINQPPVAPLARKNIVEKSPPETTRQAAIDSVKDTGSYQAEIKPDKEGITIVLHSPEDEPALKKTYKTKAGSTATNEKKSTQQAPAQKRPPKQDKEEITHIVIKGDTLWAIAEHYVNNPYKYPQLAKLSKIKNPDRIYPGNRVRILRHAKNTRQ